MVMQIFKEEDGIADATEEWRSNMQVRGCRRHIYILM